MADAATPPVLPFALIRCAIAILLIGASLPKGLFFMLGLLGLVVECFPGRDEAIGRDGYVGLTLLTMGRTVGTWGFAKWVLGYALPVLGLVLGVMLLRAGPRSIRLLKGLKT